METSENQIDFESLLGESLFSAQESHASQVPWPGSEKAKQTTVGSGTQLSMLFDTSSQLGAFSKILMESSAWTNSEEFCYVWEHLDTKSGCSAFQLTALAQSTDDIGYSLLPTPDTLDAMPPKSQERLDHERNFRPPTNGRKGRTQPNNLRDVIAVQSGQRLWRTPNAAMVTGGGQDGERHLASGHAMQLTDQVLTPKLWPTPNAGNFNDGESVKTWEKRRQKNKEKGVNGNGHGTPLAIAAKLWPTPTVPNGGRRNKEGTSITGMTPDGKKRQIDLREFAIRMYPTPQAHDAAKGSPDRVGRYGTKHGGRNLNDEVADESSGSLSPRFVEELMGFPIDHTALSPSATASFHNRRTRFSKRSPKSKETEV